MREMGTKVSKDDSPATPTISSSVEWKRDTENTPVYAVVSAVAEVEDSDPVELPPLYGTINPEALNDLFTSRPEPAVETVSFQYAGYDVVVRGNGEVQVQSASEA